MLWDDSATRPSNHSEGFSRALPLHGSSLQHFAFTLLDLMFHKSFIKKVPPESFSFYGFHHHSSRFLRYFWYQGLCCLHDSYK